MNITNTANLALQTISDEIQLAAVNSISRGGRNHTCRHMLNLAFFASTAHRHHTIGGGRFACHICIIYTA